MIKFENVIKRYASKNENAVDNLNLEVSSGEIFGFLGPNGAGKSTAIHMMISQLIPTSGKISIFGYDSEIDSDKIKEIIGFVNDEPLLFENLSGRAYLKFIAQVFKLSKDDYESRVKNYAQRLNLYKDLDFKIKDYSHGMKQKLSIIAALIHEPKLFVLDEPLVGLDPKSSFEVKTIMSEYAKQGNIVFFSTHVLEVAQNICTKLAIIDHGKTKFIGTLEELRDLEKSEGNLEELFLKLTEGSDE